ncbi:MAG TPA: hypothetical protein VGA37_16890 [Gemmatimonadales bacterium]
MTDYPFMVRIWSAGTALLLVTAACKPESVTAARDQLRRGGERTFELRLTVTDDSIITDDFLPVDADTVIDGILGIAIDQQPFVVPAVDSFMVPVEPPADAFDFGDFEEPVRNAVIEQARARLILTNDSAQQVVLTDFVFGVVELNPDGSVPRLPDGTPRYDTTDAGLSRAVPVTDPGVADFTIAGNSTAVADVEAGIVIDGLVNLVLDDRRGAMVMSGSGSGGGTPVTLLGATVDLVVLMDLTLPSAGVVFETSQSLDGAEFDVLDARQVAERITAAGISAQLVNGTPYEVDIEFAFAEGDLGEEDLFLDPTAVIVGPIPVAGGTVDSAGRVLEPGTNEAVLTLSGIQTVPLLGDRFTVRSRITIRGASSTNRAVLRPGDMVRFLASVLLSINSGGGS